MEVEARKTGGIRGLGLVRGRGSGYAVRSQLGYILLARCGHGISIENHGLTDPALRCGESPTRKESESDSKSVSIISVVSEGAGGCIFKASR